MNEKESAKAALAAIFAETTFCRHLYPNTLSSKMSLRHRMTYQTMLKYKTLKEALRSVGLKHGMRPIKSMNGIDGILPAHMAEAFWRISDDEIMFRIGGEGHEKPVYPRLYEKARRTLIDYIKEQGMKIEDFI